MTRSSLISPSSRRRSQATAKRAVCLLMAALALVPCVGQATLNPELADVLVLAAEPSALDNMAPTIDRLLACLCAGTVDAPGGLRLGAWAVSPNGYAFCVPDDFSLAGSLGDPILTLVDGEHAAQANRTIISLQTTAAAKADPLENLTESQIERAYAGTFRRFALMQARPMTLFGEEGVRIVFTSEDRQPMLTLQYIFDRDGTRYYITLTMEHSFETVARGLASLEAFCASLRFAPADT